MTTRQIEALKQAQQVLRTLTYVDSKIKNALEAIYKALEETEVPTVKGEVVDITKWGDFPSFLTLVAITRAKIVDDIPSNPVEVTLLVNGIQVPFVESMNDISERMEKNLDDRAKEIALKLVTEAGLDGISDALREAEWKIKNALGITDE